MASQIFVKFRLIFRRSYFWNTVYSEKRSVTRLLSQTFCFLLILRLLVAIFVRAFSQTLS
ncbi:hypothetical protein D9Z05_00875 [Enterococcus faecium]|uniref:Uncharacterized protein n=1 Tax=Enterococcus faecium TaxID=1352 RepID=A0AAI8PZQ6_ENTFC|nr:hypothetical protein D9Z05_00875 [Enterococcus faecium]